VFTRNEPVGLKLTHDAAREALVDPGGGGELSLSPRPGRLHEELTGDACTPGREDRAGAPSALEAVRLALDMNEEAWRKQPSVARQVDPRDAGIVAELRTDVPHEGYGDERDDSSRLLLESCGVFLHLHDGPANRRCISRSLDLDDESMGGRLQHQVGVRRFDCYHRNRRVQEALQHPGKLFADLLLEALAHAAYIYRLARGASHAFTASKGCC